MSSHSAAAQPQQLAPFTAASSFTPRAQAVRVAAFAALSLGLAATATIAVPASLLPFVLALGPTVIAVTLAWREGNGAAGRILRTAVTRPNRRAWYAVVALPLAWALGTVAVAVALGEPPAGLWDRVVPSIFIVPLVVLVPAFAEEIAWRGYAVSRLLPSMPPLAAALALAVPWATLHVFLLLPGQMNEGLELWSTLLSLVAYSVVLTWIYVGTGGSVLIAALVHAGFNGVVPLMGGVEPDLAWTIRALLVAALAVAIVVAGGLQLRRRS